MTHERDTIFECCFALVLLFLLTMAISLMAAKCWDVPNVGEDMRTVEVAK